MMSLNTWVQLSTPTDRESKVKKTVRERQLKSGEKGKEAVEIGHVKKGPLEKRECIPLLCYRLNVYIYQLINRINVIH